MILNPALLDARYPTADENEFRATVHAHGLYNAFHFVLRLSPMVHQRLAMLPTGWVTAEKIGPEGVQAFSTYLHETIHWWQHIGTTHGLMRSLSYPTQSHGNYKHCRDLLARGHFVKSVHKYAAQINRATPRSETAALLNVVLNNHFDIEWFRRMTYSPKAARATAREALFECTGHSHFVAYLQNLLVLSTIADETFDALPDPRQWAPAFSELAHRQEAGFYYGSPVALWPIGVQQIFEGQARITQIQYLHFGSGGRWDWDDARGANLLDGIYGEAFNHFLRLTELNWPQSVDHPTVGLFLLLCDMALNPGAGFPFTIRHFPHFVADTDPGARFATLCRVVVLKCPGLRTAIRNYSRNEYIEVTEELSKAALIESPMAIVDECERWLGSHAGIQALMQEYERFAYGEVNNPVRVLFTHFLAFVRDKRSLPEFFCWTGAHMAGQRASEQFVGLFNRHGALFVDKEDDDGIYPRLHGARPPEAISRTFQDFYTFNVAYDMNRQWIMHEGPFVYEYDWLSQQFTREELKGFADRTFEGIYGVVPDTVQLI